MTNGIAYGMAHAIVNGTHRGIGNGMANSLSPYNLHLSPYPLPAKNSSTQVIFMAGSSQRARGQAMKMNQTSTEKLDALVALARSVRPEWDVPGVRNAIRQSLARAVQPTIAELAYALIRCAENPTINTPAVVPMDGAHWKTGIKDGADVERNTRCHTCAEWHLPSKPCPPDAWMQRTPETDEFLAYVEHARRIAQQAKRPPDRTETNHA